MIVLNFKPSTKWAPVLVQIMTSIVSHAESMPDPPKHRCKMLNKNRSPLIWARVWTITILELEIYSQSVTQKQR